MGHDDDDNDKRVGCRCQFFYGFLVTFGSFSARYRANADACVLDLFVERATKKCVMSAFFCTFADCHSAEGCMYGS